jgi:transcriptional regulator with XRE-family HTH domain
MTEAQTGASPLAELVRAARLPPPAERRRIRLAAGVSLRRMGDELGVSAVTVHNWETNGDGPGLENATRYRRLLEQLAAAVGTQLAGSS